MKVFFIRGIYFVFRGEMERHSSSIRKEAQNVQAGKYFYQGFFSLGKFIFCVLFACAGCVVLQHVFSCYRMCSLTIECVLQRGVIDEVGPFIPTLECVLLLLNVFSHYRMCSAAGCHQ